jgi:hypothetical protein
MKTIEKYKKIHLPWFDCHVTAMRDMLHYHDLNISAYLCFGLAGGIGFNYIPVDRSTKPTMPPARMPFWIIMGSSQNYMDICKELGIRYTIERFFSPDEAWVRIQHFIDEAIPVMIDIPDLFLYKDDQSINSVPAFQNFFGQTQVPPFIDFITSGSKNMVIGYDEGRESALLVNNMAIGPLEVGIPVLKRLQSESRACPRIDSEIVTFEVPRQLLPLDFLIKKAIFKTAARLLDSALVLYDDGGRKFPQGIPGIEAFLDHLPYFAEIIPDEKVRNSTLFISVMLSTGFAKRWGAYRFPYGKFLLEAAEILKENRLRELGEIYLEVADLWTQLMNFISAKLMQNDFNFRKEEIEPFKKGILAQETRCAAGLMHYAEQEG